MPSISGDLRFFGLDLTDAWQRLRQPWLHMHEWPVLRWLTPTLPVRVLLADGSDACWQGSRRRAAAAPASAARTVAVALPEDMVLRRRIVLPDMSAADAVQALSLQVRSFSPFADTDLSWGWRSAPMPDGRLQVDVALASRRQVAQHLEAQASRLGGAGLPEVWVCPDDGESIVLAGYGEAQRGREAVRQRRIGYGLLACMALLLVAIALTPTAQLWLRAGAAQRSHQELALRAAPALVQREALLAATTPLNALGEILEPRADPLRLLALLTRVLPDDTALQSLKLQGRAVTISGQTGDAARLMQLLGEQDGLRDVRAPTPATRMAGAGKESFTIAFVLDAKAFGFGVGASASDATEAPQQAASAAPPALAASTPAVPTPMPEAAVAPASPPAPSPVFQPPPGKAVFGGGARPPRPAASSAKEPS